MRPASAGRQGGSHSLTRVFGTCAIVARLYCRVPPAVPRRLLFGVALISGSLLMTELSLTRIFSVTMYYHFAFMAISIALFGLSASGVFAYVARRRLDRHPTDAPPARAPVPRPMPCPPASR